MLDETEEVLEVQVADDGVGMETGDPKKIVKNRKEHFSGIGVQNVQERLALIYGKREEPDFTFILTACRGMELRYGFVFPIYDRRLRKEKL